MEHARGVESVKTQHMRMSIVRQFSLFMNRLVFLLLCISLNRFCEALGLKMKNLDIEQGITRLDAIFWAQRLESTEKSLRLTIEAHDSIISCMTEYYNNVYPGWLTMKPNYYQQLPYPPIF